MIKVKDLHISFNGKKVVDGIDLFVPTGHTVVLLGKNGSGKSVILKTVAGLIDGYDGKIEIDDKDISEFYLNREKTKKNSYEDFFPLAYVFQKGGLFDSMNVYDNIAFGLRRMNVDESSIKEKVLTSLSRVGLKGNENKLTSELSGGMQKRVGLARVICLNPVIILFDDPTAGLDPILSDSISDLILEIRDSLNTTSIVVTHDLDVARKIADSIALLYQGKIVFFGPGEDFFNETNEYASQFIEGETEGPISIF
ncbi:ABC transporter ATP-binding protein [Spirochaetota bacterium]